MTDDGLIYDLAIVGGGINGAGIARDAAGRGASVILIEGGDLAEGTSSASTKLIHGGLRYLEHYEFGLVRESLVEREKLWAIAPHIIRPLRFVLPHRSGLRPRWLLRTGLFLYDHLGGRRLLPPTRSVNLSRDAAGAPLQPRYTSAFEYSDCRVDDARLVVLNARDAADRGAEILTRTEVSALERVDDLWHIAIPGASIRARAAVNAAGPRVLDLLARAGLETHWHMRLVRGSHIVVPRLFDHDRAYFFQLADGRIFFAIPYEEDFTLVGTTDNDHHGSLDHIAASGDEAAYLCAGINDYFNIQITPTDAVWSYSGVRPLVDDGSGKPEAATRGYRLEIDAPDGKSPLLSIFGGKITTYRHLAEAAVDALKPWFPTFTGPGWTDREPLPGGDFPVTGLDALGSRIAERYPFLAPATVRRITRLYGTDALLWLGDAAGPTDLGQDFGHGLSAAEVSWLVTREWARTSDDILWRRTKLGLRFDAAERRALDAHLATLVAR